MRVRYEDLPTEQENPRSRGLDLMSTSELLRVIHEEDRAVLDAVGKALPEIARTVDAVAGVLAGNGRLIYVGAGTSGRLGVLDARRQVRGGEVETVQLGEQAVHVVVHRRAVLGRAHRQ